MIINSKKIKVERGNIFNSCKKKKIIKRGENGLSLPMKGSLQKTK
jgi:hypothetical protein